MLTVSQRNRGGRAAQADSKIYASMRPKPYLQISFLNQAFCLSPRSETEPKFPNRPRLFPFGSTRVPSLRPNYFGIIPVLSGGSRGFEESGRMGKGLAEAAQLAPGKARRTRRCNDRGGPRWVFAADRYRPLMGFGGMGSIRGSLGTGIAILGLSRKCDGLWAFPDFFRGVEA